MWHTGRSERTCRLPACIYNISRNYLWNSQFEPFESRTADTNTDFDMKQPPRSFICNQLHLGVSPKVSEEVATEVAENSVTVVIDNPTVVWRPLPEEPREYPHIGLPYISRNLESTIYISAADSVGLSSFKFFWWLRKTHLLQKSRSSKVSCTPYIFHPNFGGVPIGPDRSGWSQSK